jgi:diaminopimelate decarboxylase
VNGDSTASDRDPLGVGPRGVDEVEFQEGNPPDGLARSDRLDLGSDSRRGGPPVRRLGDWDAEHLRALAGEHGTPLYVLDRQRVRENYRRLAEAFPDADIYYAAKANTGLATLRTLRREGAGVECASPGELRAALDAGVAPARIHYTAVNPPAEDFDSLMGFLRDAPATTVTAGAVDTLDRLANRGYSGRIALRVNPGVGAGHHEKVATGADAQFGVPAGQVPAAVERARRDFRFVGIHAHVGSGILNHDLDRYRRAMARVGEIARSVQPIEFVDVGGGFGVPYRQSDPPLDLSEVADGIHNGLAGVDARLLLEPGRYVVADAGVLLTRVNTRKEAPDAVVAGVDASLADMLRPALFDAHHPVRNLAADADERPVEEATVGGPVCSSADTFCENRPIARPERGDVLAIGNTGAYGYELANRFHRRRLPAEVVVDGDRSWISRRRDRFEDVERPETTR